MLKTWKPEKCVLNQSIAIQLLTISLGTKWTIALQLLESMYVCMFVFVWQSFFVLFFFFVIARNTTVFNVA